MRTLPMHRNFLLIALVVIATLSMVPSVAGAITPTNTVTFYENDNPTDSVISFEPGTEGVMKDLTLFADLSPSFSDPGFYFAGWNTEPDGSGVSYTDGETYSFLENMVLYAQWTPIPATNTVTFYENDNESDLVSTYQTGSSTQGLTLFENLNPSFSDPGYTFEEWNTQANGSGTSYANGDQYSFNSNLILYAQWAPLATSSVIFNSNGASGSVLAVSDPTGTIISLPSGAGLSLTGYAFCGWNMVANGSGAEYSAGASFDMTSNETLYAQWTQDPLVEITIDANGGEGSVSTLSGVPGATVTLPSASSVSEAGHSLASWNSLADGTGTSYFPGQSVTLTEDMTLYAQWTEDETSSSSPTTSSSSTSPTSATPPSGAVVTPLSINFVANGGSGSITTLSGATGSNVKLPTSSTVVRVGYTLKSWNTESNGKGISYPPGASVTLSSSLTLYAQWSSTGAAPILYGAIGDFAQNSTGLSASLERQVRVLADVLKAKKYTEVRLYGYSASTGLATLDKSLSSARATSVATYLRDQLRSMKVADVSVSAAGEGSVTGKTSSLYSRVEVFVSRA